MSKLLWQWRSSEVKAEMHSTATAGGRGQEGSGGSRCSHRYRQLVNVVLTVCVFFLLKGGKGWWAKMCDFLQVCSTESIFKNLAKGAEGKACIGSKVLQYHIMLETLLYKGSKKFLHSELQPMRCFEAVHQDK